jgi:hypothetical protein
MEEATQVAEMVARRVEPSTTTRRSNVGSVDGSTLRTDMVRGAHRGGPSASDGSGGLGGFPLVVHRAEPVRDDPAVLQQLLDENTPDLALLVREREPNYNDLLRERISWREFYTPLGALFEQHLKQLVRERDTATGMRAWDGRLPK